MNWKCSLCLSFAAALQAQGPPASPQQPRPEPMLLPQVLVLPRGATELQIDGSLRDWPELPAVRMDDTRQVSGTASGAYRGGKDLSGVAFLLWDDDALYFGMAVQDDWHRPLDKASLQLVEVPVADSVLLSFDPARDTRANGPDPGRIEDRDFWLADQAARQLVQWDRLRGTARVLEGDDGRAVVLHDKEQGITSYEARIPWKEILPVGRKPAVGSVVDLQIVVNDFDESTDSMPQTRIGLTFGCSPIVDPGLYASMMLVADAAALQGAVPQFPPKPASAEPPAKPKEYWADLTARLLQFPPAIYDGSTSPADCGGSRRLAVLEEIDGHCAQWPRIDLLEFHQRIHRRMNREVAGFTARGLPSWWRARLVSVSKNAEDDVPAGAVRLFRLPTGGWLFRSARGNFVVDPAGADIPDALWGGAQFCVLTQPLDMTRRQDQLLLGMFAAEPPRPVYTHIAFHLPTVGMDKMPLAELGKSYGAATGMQVHALGEAQADGQVPWSCSYRIDVPNGPRVLLAGPTLRAKDAAVGVAIDVMVASPRNPELPAIVVAAKPRLVVIDDAFECQSMPQLDRMTLRQLHAVQQQLRPTPSLILAPGESWTVTVGK
ncbi:MAG: hypothetical protein ACK501_15330 [Planctomycetota bacterium]